MASPVAAAHLLQRPQDGVQRFAVIVVVQQLYQHLGVCFAAEFIASFHKVLLELGVVFNDAVVHQADARGAMGMAVYVAGGAVRSPACVPDAAVRGHGGMPFSFSARTASLPCALTTRISSFTHNATPAES